MINGHVAYIASFSLVLVSRYKRVATVGNFYIEDPYAIISGKVNLIKNNNT
jgi:hypothetical protein